jgi:hypothetical protein
MPLSWNEIKERAVRFSKEFENAFNEEAEAQQFLIHFFDVFGISNRQVSLFEYKVKKLDDSGGYIDLFWKGMIVIEMKSRGKSLDKAYEQAKDYIHGLKSHEIPKYILVSDFENFRLFNLEDQSWREFKLKDLVNNVQYFDAMAGYQKHTYKEEDPVNIRAAELMGRLHDKLKDVGYEGHPLELYLVRLLFCLFADDTGIFEKDIFHDYLLDRTSEDGSDLAMHLEKLFYVLNTSRERRLKNLDESENAFPYVNGKLFEEVLPPASFDKGMRQILLECCYLNWSLISPAIFGSMFQSVMNPEERRNLGAHYTSEKNILKLIKPLFLDELWQEFDSVKSNTNKLKGFHRKLASLRFLDPACGCGNFLVITYRELRLIELSILRELHGTQKTINITNLVACDVDRFYGIEYEEFPAQIAQVALWLMDHQMNMVVSQEFGEYYVRLPLIKSAKITHTNALRIEWNSLIEHLPWENESDLIKFDFILGNPPFVGQHLQSAGQKEDMNIVFESVKGAGVLDYVAAWYIRAAQYIKIPIDPLNNRVSRTKVAFVSTNSIVQGEQVGIIWNELFHRYGVKIHFAHRTFKWNNDARGNAAVHVVIVGFANYDIQEKVIFEYDDIKAVPRKKVVRNINAYLVEGKDFFLSSRMKPLNTIPEMKRGNSPYDGGNFLFTNPEKEAFVAKEPDSDKFFKRFLGAREFINNEIKWCLWLKDVSPSILRSSPLVMERIRNVQEFRANSPGKETQAYALTPSVFRDKNNPTSFIVVPRVSSENRRYIPNGFFDDAFIAGDTCMIIPNASIFNFGILTSEMHMTWVKYVCGRLKSDFRYSKDIVYNNYPWPDNPSEKLKEAVNSAAQNVLDIRILFQTSSLADLYDSLSMPPTLAKAHQTLDKAVDSCYRSQPFSTETKRIEFLFDLYEKYTGDLFKIEKPKKKKQ